MKAEPQKAWLCLISWLVLCSWATAAAELRTWTFGQDGQMCTSANGTISFKKKGRLDAVFIRLTTDNRVVLSNRTGYVTIASTNLSAADWSYVARVSGIDQSAAGSLQTSDMVRNEMSRRKREAAQLRDEAAMRRRLAQEQLDAAADLDKQAAELSGCAFSFQSLAVSREATAENSKVSQESSSLAGLERSKNAAIAAAATGKLAQDIASLRRQAELKRQNAASLQNEAAKLEQTAQSEDAAAMDHPSGLRAPGL